MTPFIYNIIVIIIDYFANVHLNTTIENCFCI